MVFQGFSGESYAILRAIKGSKKKKGNAQERGYIGSQKTWMGVIVSNTKPKRLDITYLVFANQKILSEQRSRPPIAM
jgi:hypothetical protein